jgi:hypothetical protein
MQKFGFALLLILPALSYANSVRLVNASIHNQDGNTGYGLSYTGINNKFITTLACSGFQKTSGAPRHSVLDLIMVSNLLTPVRFILVLELPMSRCPVRLAQLVPTI